MRRPIATLLLALVALAPLAACGDDDGDTTAEDTGTTAPAQDPIAGRTFEATDLESETATLVDGVTVQLAFTEDEITVEAGCNRMTGTYELDGPILVVTDLAGTEMGCAQELMAQDAWFSSALTTRPVITPTPPDGLVLSSEGWTLTLAEPAADDGAAAELVGPTWVVDTLIDGESASSVPTGITATVAFAEDGTYQVAAGCNTGSGTYAEAGAGIYQIDTPALTRKRCDDAAMDVEAAVAAVLDGEVAVAIEGDRLTLSTTGEDPTGLGLTAT